MGLSNVQLLLGVNFLHFFSAGLIAPVLAQHVRANGGNHLLLGLLAAALFMSNKISKDFLSFFNHGNKLLLKFCLLSAFVTYLTLIFNENRWMIFFNRCFYVLINQISSVSKDYVSKSETGETQMNSLNLLEVTEVAGIVCGAISGGYIFEFKEEFSIIATTASVSTLWALLLVQYIDSDVSKISRPADLLSLSRCYSKVENLKSVDYANKWIKLLVLSTYFFCVSAYFSRFAFLLTSNYHVDNIVIGYTVAYQFMWKFFSDIAAPYLKDQITKKRSLFECSLLICGLTLSGLYYVPNYEMYLIVFIPMMVTNALINSLLTDDILELKNDDAIHTITDVIHICAPICFGLLCHVYEDKAFRYLLLLPIVVCLYLIKQKFGLWQSDNDEDKRKED